MAIDERDFFASHGLNFDYKNMLDEYIKGVIKQAKIEVLTELQSEIEELAVLGDARPNISDGYHNAMKDVLEVVHKYCGGKTDENDN